MMDILLVDDNAIQATTRKAILSRTGYRVTTASSAPQALELLQDPSSSASIRLIITDHLMPEMNGPEFVTILRRDFPSLPIIVLSGLPDAESDYRGMNVIYRLKPIAPEALIELAREISEQTLGRTA